MQNDDRLSPEARAALDAARKAKTEDGKLHWVQARIPVEIKGSDVGLYYATSPLIKGLLVSEHTEKEALEASVRAIEDLGCATSYSKDKSRS